MIGIKPGIPMIRSDAPLEDFPGLKIGHFNDYAGLVITLPACISREDFERIRTEIQAAMDWAELRGEQKAIAFLTGEGSGPVLGIVGQSELTQAQADALAASERDGCSFKEFIQEFAKALEMMNTMLGAAVQEFSVGEGQ